jgi:molybdate transport system substrate-binding protein
VPVAALVARGEVTLGFQQLSELIDVPGVDVVGVLPATVQAPTVFAGAVCTAARHAPAARELLAFFASPAGDEARRRNGMDAV